MSTRWHHDLITLHDLVQWRLQFLVKGSQNHLLCRAIEVLQRGRSSGVDIAFPNEELLGVRVADCDGLGLDLNIPKASIGQQCTQFVGIAEGEDCSHARCSKTSRTYLIECLIEGMPIQTLPDTQYHAPVRPEHTVHFRESGMSIRKEHESELAQYQVKITV